MVEKFCVDGGKEKMVEVRKMEGEHIVCVFRSHKRNRGVRKRKQKGEENSMEGDGEKENNGQKWKFPIFSDGYIS